MSEEVSLVGRVGVAIIVLALILEVFNVVGENLKQLIVEYAEIEPRSFV